MKAKILNPTCNGKIASNRKERGFFKEIAALDPKDGSNPVTARIYWPGQTMVYACIWVNSKAVHTMGGGRAGGGGYHKPSAALCAALSDAGVNLDENISGAGDGAMEAAIEAIAKAVGVKKPIIHVAHG